MGKLSKKLENLLELRRGPQGSRANGNKETQAGSLHKAHSHLRVTKPKSFMD